MASQSEVEAPKKRIILNAFDMFTVGHLSFGQWRNPKDRSADKRRDLTYWTDLAKLLEEGDFNALFLADTYGVYDVYKGSAEPAVRTGAQFPIGDPVIPISAMAAVTKNLGFTITTSTSYESPYLVAKRFSTLDHLTKGRFGWNMVTSWKESASKAVGLKHVEHDQRYKIADDFVRVLYKLWEGSWANDALVEDRKTEIYSDYNRIRTIHHNSENFHIEAPHILDPSPQRTPFLFQAGTSEAGIEFGATHAEGIFVTAISPHILAPKVKNLRAKAAEKGRDPQSIKIFAAITPIIGATEEEADAKYKEALSYASEEGGLTVASGGLGLDLSILDIDTEITPSINHGGATKVLTMLDNLSYHGDDVPTWTPRNFGKIVSIGGLGPLPVGTPAQVADFMEEWMDVADLDGFVIGYVLTPGSFEDVVRLLVPELRKRGLYAPEGESGTMRERVYGKGQSKLRDDHIGSTYKYANYTEEGSSGAKTDEKK